VKIAVLNGSPKGDLSVTMQYVNFIQKRFPHHELKILNIASTIKRIEKDEKAFQEIMDDVESSDGVLWAFPVYFLLVSSQYKRFIELLWERGTTDVFKNKYAAVFSTSIHFFDHTAHQYMNAICDDLDMKYLGSFSAGMYDLLNERERERWAILASEFFEGIQTRVPTSKRFLPIVYRAFDYTPGSVGQKMSTRGKRVRILTDLTDPHANLSKMIERFKKTFVEEVEVTNLHDLDIKGGCLGCIQCGYDYQCSYGGQDEYVQFYRDQVQKADILIFAGTIRDRYLSSRWKMFFDRSFFHTHTPSLMGKQVGVLLSGPLKQISNLRQILEAYTEFQQANLVDIITDESEEAQALDAQLHYLAQRVIHLAEKNYKKPNTFLGVGGMKIFRDDVWGKLRFPFQADHRFYKKHGIYDFPQRDYKTRAMVTILTLLTKIPRIRREIYRKRMREEMIKPLQKVVRRVGT
jgi:multimeric flavodoxin WrbA